MKMMQRLAVLAMVLLFPRVAAQETSSSRETSSPRGTSSQKEPSSLQETSSLQDTLSLQDVTISVIPFQEKYGEATGGIVTISTGEQNVRHTINAADLINQAPGVYMASGTYNTNRLVIRGVGSRTPYHSNRIRAYLDDIPLTSGDGVTSLEDLDVLGIGSIEILKGPSSALYGSGLGGVVRLNSPYPRKDGFTAATVHTLGSFRTLKNGFHAGYKGDRLALFTGLSRSHSDGYRENSTYTRSNAFLSARYFGRRNTLSFTLNLVDLTAQIPSSLSESDFLEHPRKAAGNWLAIEGHETYLKVLGGLKLETDISRRLENRLVLFSTFRDPYESRPFNILDDRFYNLGFRETFQVDLSDLQIQTGMEYFYEWVDWQIYETENGEQGRLLSDHGERRQYMNTFLYVHWKPSGRLVLDAGLNANLLRYDLESHFNADTADHSGRYRYSPVLSPRLGISYNHTPGHYVYFSAGHGFSAPSLEETLLPEGNINTALKPETGWNLEVGGRGMLLQNTLQYDATLYAVYLNNLLVTERVAEDIFTGVNAGSALNSGFEFRGSFRPRSLWDVPLSPEATLGVTLSRNRFVEFIDEGTDHSGNNLPGIPGGILHAALSGSLQAFEMDLQYRYTGSQWMDDANTGSYHGYHLVNIQLGWSLDLKSIPVEMELTAGIRNLVDTHYASMILVNAPSFGGTPARPYYPGLPRRVHAGFSIRYR